MKITDPRIRLPWLLTVCFPKAVFKGPISGNQIYLTFDDGPVPEVTPWVLDILKKENIKACFFCVGENVQRYPEIYRQVIDEGHLTGNHTFNHLSGLKVSTDDYVKNIEKAAQFIDSRLFRPPHGLMKRTQYKLLSSNFRIIMWDVVSRDYIQKLSPGDVAGNVLDNVRPGSIIIFHDSIKAKKNLYEALPVVIGQLKMRGYRFGQLG